MLEEGLSEIAWSAWLARSDRWALACKLSDKNIENAPVDQIVVDLEGNEDKEALLGKIKAAVVKKRSVFLSPKDLHQLTQGRGEDPERYAARIKQAAPPCC